MADATEDVAVAPGFFALTFVAGHPVHEARDYASDLPNRILTNAVRFGPARSFAAAFFFFTVADALLVVLASLGVVPRILLARDHRPGDGRGRGPSSVITRFGDSAWPRVRLNGFPVGLAIVLVLSVSVRFTSTKRVITFSHASSGCSSLKTEKRIREGALAAEGESVLVTLAGLTDQRTVATTIGRPLSC